MLHLLAALLLIVDLAAQSAPRLLVDLNTTPTGPLSSSPAEFVRIGAWSYFTADDGTHGRELFRTGGTAASTSLVLDLQPGGEGSDPQLWPARTRLFLFADDGVHGREPWISDGTAAGTRMLIDVVPGSAGSGGGGAGVLDDRFLFTDWRTGQRALWITDGTPSGTQRIVDESLLQPHERFVSEVLTISSTRALLLWGDGQTSSLWSTDGTRGGTRRVRSNFSSTYTRSLKQLAAVPGGAVLFEHRLTTPPFALVMWVTDGTTAGTIQIGTFPFFAKRIYHFDGRVWASGLTREFFVTDGTAAGSRVFDVNYLGSGMQLMEFYGELGGRLWGVARLVNSSAIRQLVRIDAGNPLPRLAGRFDNAPDPTQGAAATIGSRFVVFSASGDVTALDPSARTLTSLDLTVQPPAEVGYGFGRIYFGGSDPAGAAGTELYASDGTPAGTRLVVDLRPGPRGTRDAEFGSFTAFGSRAAFVATRGGAREVWTTDGTPANTIPVMTGLGSISFLGGTTGVQYFTAIPVGGSWSLFVTDGTPAGTRTLYPGTVGANPPFRGQALALGSRVLFVSDSDGGGELYATDGTMTQQLARLGGYWSTHPPFRAGSNAYYSVIEDESPGPAPVSRLWVTDGTPAGTRQLGRFAFGHPGGFPSPSTFAVLDDVVYFVPRDPNGPYEIWRTDGTPGGTRRVGPVGGASSMFADPPMVFATRSHLIASMEANGLWSLDPVTGAITRLPIWMGWLRRVPKPVLLNGCFLFDAVEPVTGLYVPHLSDGSVAGTRPITTSVYRSSSNTDPYLPAGEGRAVFRAYDAVSRRQVTVLTDGTATGTHTIADLNWSTIVPLGLDAGRVTATAGGRLFFGASDAFAGLEPHAFELGATVQNLSEACGRDGRRAELLASLGSSPNGGFALEGRSSSGVLALILLSPPPRRALPPAPAGACFIDVDLNVSVPLALLPITNGRFAQAWPLPDDPALYGIQAAVQGFAGPTNAPLGVDFTNGLLLQLGR